MCEPCDHVGRASAACSVFEKQVALVRRGFACSKYLAPAIRRIVRYAGLPSECSRRVPSNRKTRHENRRRKRGCPQIHATADLHWCVVSVLAGGPGVPLQTIRTPG